MRIIFLDLLSTFDKNYQVSSSSSVGLLAYEEELGLCSQIASQLVPWQREKLQIYEESMTYKTFIRP